MTIDERLQAREARFLLLTPEQREHFFDYAFGLISDDQFDALIRLASRAEREAS